MIDKLINPVSNILDKFIADKDLKQKLNHEIELEIQKANTSQIEVNKVEAGHRSIFVAGWRPCCGWICAIALGYHFVLQPIILFVLSLYDLQYELPEFDMGALLYVLGGMLGLGGLRSYEKSKGLTK
ncbi:holin family protein [Pseudomonadales bacterium]|nr:holin family protein [Pseudomonadales bacterium]